MDIPVNVMNKTHIKREGLTQVDRKMGQDDIVGVPVIVLL